MAQFEWQWLSAPAGHGEMWLIETEAPDGSPLIVGHHGLMPLYFSAGKNDLLAGKTENTMVHPKYRKKLLYPKYEKQFLKSYANKFDLLFSTVGPPAALRQRKALGYSSDRRWRHIEIALGPLAMTGLLASLAASAEAPSTKRAIAATGLRAGARIVSALPRYRNRSGPALCEFQVGSTRTTTFFESFWNVARYEHPITPRRNFEDLNWRFWSNPHVHTKTIFTPNESAIQGYAIITQVDRYHYRLDDIAVLPNEPSAMAALICSVCDWCASEGALVLSFMTTDDPKGPGAAIDAADLPHLETRWPLAKLRPPLGQPMLRRITERSSKSLSIHDWFVTPFILEGRS